MSLNAGARGFYGGSYGPHENAVSITAEDFE